MFKTLDEMYRKSLLEEKPPCNIPKTCIEKYTDIKEYKRQYYLKNIAIYKERNANYRKQKKLEKLNRT